MIEKTGGDIMGFFKRNTGKKTVKKTGGFKILAVDDEADVRTLLQDGLEAEGHTVIPAVDGEDALQKIKDEKPDLVILDIRMPKMDGIQVLQIIKNDPSTRKLPVIMLTVNASDEDMFKGCMYGADVYLTKPFKLQDILTGIALAFKRDPRNTTI